MSKRPKPLRAVARREEPATSSESAFQSRMKAYKRWKVSRTGSIMWFSWYVHEGFPLANIPLIMAR